MTTIMGTSFISLFFRLLFFFIMQNFIIRHLLQRNLLLSKGIFLVCGTISDFSSSKKNVFLSKGMHFPRLWHQHQLFLQPQRHLLVPPIQGTSSFCTFSSTLFTTTKASSCFSVNYKTSQLVVIISSSTFVSRGHLL